MFLWLEAYICNAVPIKNLNFLQEWIHISFTKKSMALWNKITDIKKAYCTLYDLVR